VRSKKYFWLFVAASALLVLALTWIAWRQALDRVTVTLVDVSLRLGRPSVGAPLSVIADTTFEITNDNFLGAEVDTIDYAIYVNGAEVGTGSGPGSQAGRKVPANGRGRILTTTRLPGYQLASAGLESILRRSVEVDVRGKAHLTVLVFGVERDFRLRAPALIGGITVGDVLGVPADGKRR